MMKKTLFGIAVMLVLLAFTVTPVAAGLQKGHQVLVGKNPADWSIVPGMFADFNGKSLNFHAEGLKSNTSYTVISYAEPWPGTGSVGIVTFETNSDGMVDFKGKSSFYNYPLIYNEYTSGEYAGQIGAKIWIVPSSDFAGGVLAWDPANFLFETKLIPEPTS